jgi:hypothetical protein
MSKKITDYLHLFLGCEILWEFTDGSGGGTDTMTSYHLNEHRIGSITIKPILRSLSTMNEEESNNLAHLYSEWAWRKEYRVQSLDFTDKAAFLTIYYILEGGPHGIGDGEYTEQLIISPDSIWARSYAERSHYKIVLNVHQMEYYLLSRSFDLFNLIDEGLAIDKATLNP